MPDNELRALSNVFKIEVRIQLLSHERWLGRIKLERGRQI